MGTEVLLFWLFDSIQHHPWMPLAELLGSVEGNQTFRTIDYSYHRRFVPLVDFSYLGRFIPWIFRTILGLFVPFVRWTFRTILGLFVPFVPVAPDGPRWGQPEQKP